ncbi:MAG: T9SS type A sorting domain-containing protein, partial [bacterium]
HDGDAVTFCAPWVLPDSLDHDVYVVVDPNQIIRECDETDNTAMKTFIYEDVCGHCDLARSWGYWKHQCQGNGYTEVTPEELAEYKTEILALSSVFDECHTTYGCQLLLADPPNDDMRRKAAQQLYTLWLNIISRKISLNCEIYYPDLTMAMTVGEAVDDIEAVLCDPSASKDELERVKDLGDMLNNSGTDEVEVAFTATDIFAFAGESYTIDGEVVNLSSSSKDIRITAGGEWNVSAYPKLLENVQPGVPAPVQLWIDVPADAAVEAFKDLVTLTAAIVGDPYKYNFEVARISVKASRTTDVDETPKADVTLSQNFPNPFNPVTMITVGLPKEMSVTLTIYNLEGKRIRTLVEGKLPVGTNIIRWDGTDWKGRSVSSGIYLCRLKAGERVLTRKMVLLR